MGYGSWDATSYTSYAYNAGRSVTSTGNLSSTYTAQDIDKALMITHYDPEQFIMDTDKLARFDDCYISSSRYSEEVEVWHSYESNS